MKTRPRPFELWVTKWNTRSPNLNFRNKTETRKSVQTFKLANNFEQYYPTFRSYNNTLGKGSFTFIHLHCFKELLL